MDFKEAITAYKEGGDRTIINDIMTAVEMDFMSYDRERVKDGSVSGGIRIDLAAHHEYVAYSIRAMRELLMRHVKIEYDEDIRGLGQFQRHLSIINIDFGINFNGT